MVHFGALHTGNNSISVELVLPTWMMWISFFVLLKTLPKQKQVLPFCIAACSKKIRHCFWNIDVIYIGYTWSLIANKSVLSVALKLGVHRYIFLIVNELIQCLHHGIASSPNLVLWFFTSICTKGVSYEWWCPLVMVGAQSVLVTDI